MLEGGSRAGEQGLVRISHGQFTQRQTGDFVDGHPTDSWEKVPRKTNMSDMSDMSNCLKKGRMALFQTRCAVAVKQN